MNNILYFAPAQMAFLSFLKDVRNIIEITQDLLLKRHDKKTQFITVPSIYRQELRFWREQFCETSILANQDFSSDRDGIRFSLWRCSVKFDKFFLAFQHEINSFIKKKGNSAKQ
jgi:hypothetical protein